MKFHSTFANVCELIWRTLTYALLLPVQKQPNQIVDPIFFALSNKKVKATWAVVSVSSNRLKFSEFFYFEAHAAPTQISTWSYIRVGVIFPTAIALNRRVFQLTCMEISREWKEISWWFCYNLNVIPMIFHNCPAFEFHAIFVGFQHAITEADRLPLSHAFATIWIFSYNAFFFFIWRASVSMVGIRHCTQGAPWCPLNTGVSLIFFIAGLSSKSLFYCLLCFALRFVFVIAAAAAVLDPYARIITVSVQGNVMTMDGS